MTMNSPNLRQPNFSNFKKSHVIKVLTALVLEYGKVNFELLQACTCDTRWRTTCSMWHISFFMATACGLPGLPKSHSQINSSPSNGLVHKLIFVIPCTIEFNKNVSFSAVFKTFDTVNLEVNIHYVLRNIFPRYVFSLRKFHKFSNFLSPNVFMQWICQSFPLPKFPSIRDIQ